jgi:hypothetical protein
MRTAASADFESRAAASLTALLSRISTIRLKEITRQPPVRGRIAAIHARVEVFGRSHMLACAIDPSGESSPSRAALSRLESADFIASEITPVLIVRHLSPEVQAHCKEHRAGFLDLDGNARLTMGEVFIVVRSISTASQPIPMPVS